MRSVGRAGHAYLAAMELHQRSDDCQPQTAAGFAPSAGILPPVEPYKDQIALRLRDARAGIGNGDPDGTRWPAAARLATTRLATTRLDTARLAAGTRRHLDLPTLRG